MTVQDWLGEDNELGISIFEQKYRYNNESFDEWLDRVSGKSEELKQLILQKKFLFGGRILANRGLYKNNKVTYSNCYVIQPPEDNLESIFNCAKKLARTYSYGGGCGVDLSKLAPKGSKVRNAAKESSGAVSFMDLYSLVTGLIAQEGRRGALMLSMDCNHPDIEEFINIKNDLNRVTKANISIKITNDFIEAIEANKDYTLSFTRVETGETISKKVNARKIFHKIAENNWNMGEPGMLFWNTIQDWNLLSDYDNFAYAGVNPCAEEPLPAGGSCLLGSINLSAFVTRSGLFDFEEFKKAVALATRALNEILDEGLPLHPLTEQRESVGEWRQIGLGIMGLADMLIKMKIIYGSKGAIELCNQIACTLLNTAVLESSLIAKEKGSFEKYNYDSLKKSLFYQLQLTDKVKQSIAAYGLRNSQLLTIAPTGTLSTMLGISGGIEPIFANYYTRKTESLYGKDVYFKVYTPIVKKFIEENNLEDDSQLPKYFITSAEINPINRIKMQAIWQKYIDASISSTINLPETATIEDVENIYLEAYHHGLKGITVFRSGCKRSAILSTNSTNSNNTEKEQELPRGYIIDASDNLIGKKRKLITGCGSLHCTAFFDPLTGDLRETYLSKGSTGGCNNFMVGLSRMISLAARGGCSIDAIIDQLNSAGVCPSYATRSAVKRDTSPGSCCPVAIGKALKEMWQEMQNDIQPIEKKPNKLVTQDTKINKIIPDVMHCPECGEELIHEGGCDICKNCGWSKCS